MASRFLKKFSVPEKFPGILSKLTTEILRNQPENIIEFCTYYFEEQTGGYKGDPGKRIDSGRSHNTEKKMTKDYMSSLYESALKESSRGDMSHQEEKITYKGILNVNIVSAINLEVDFDRAPNAYCVAFLSNDPNKIIKTEIVENELNPFWEQNDRFMLQVTEEDLQEICLVVQVFNSDGLKTLLGESAVRLEEIILNQGNKFELGVELETPEEREEGNEIAVQLELQFIAEEQTLELGNEDEDNENEQPAMQFKGEISVNILSANDLISDDDSVDTYCVAFLSINPTKFLKTSIVSSTNNPEWNHNDRFAVSLTENEICECELVIQVFNSFGTKTLIGEGSMSLLDMFSNPEMPVQNSVELIFTQNDYYVSGMVNIECKWNPEE